MLVTRGVSIYHKLTSFLYHSRTTFPSASSLCHSSFCFFILTVFLNLLIWSWMLSSLRFLWCVVRSWDADLSSSLESQKYLFWKHVSSYSSIKIEYNRFPPKDIRLLENLSKQKKKFFFGKHVCSYKSRKIKEKRFPPKDLQLLEKKNVHNCKSLFLEPKSVMPTSRTASYEGTYSPYLYCIEEGGGGSE